MTYFVNTKITKDYYFGIVVAVMEVVMVVIHICRISNLFNTLKA